MTFYDLIVAIVGAFVISTILIIIIKFPEIRAEKERLDRESQ